MSRTVGKCALVLTTQDLLIVDAIAERVAALMRNQSPCVQLVDAATVAAALGVSRDCVYAHAEQLGGRRIGDGPHGRLRFDLTRALEGWTHRSGRDGSEREKSSPAAGRKARRPATKPPDTAKLLPIHDPGRPITLEDAR